LTGKKGCKKSEIKFKDRCWPKVMCEPKLKVVLDWTEVSKEDKPVGCWIDGAHTRAKCVIPAVLEEDKKFTLGKAIQNSMQRKGAKTYTIKEKDFGYTGAIKVGNATYNPGYLLQILEEINGERYVSKSGNAALKNKVGKKIKFGYWQSKEKDMPLVLEGNGGLYVLAPRIE